MAAMDADTGSGPADMRACADTAVTNTGAHANGRTRMRAGINAVAADTAAGADRTDMGARAHTMLADMRANTHAQHIHTRADIGISRGQTKQGERKDGRGDRFHGGVPVRGHGITA
jgi:hypothetical protein